MNIVWLTWKDLDHPLAGGAEVVNEELAARLAAAGHTVTFLTGGFSNAPAHAARRGFTIIRTGRRFTTYLTTARYFLKHRAKLNPHLVIDECNTMPYFAGWYARAPTVLFFHMLCRQIWFYEFPPGLAQLGWLLEPVYLRLLRPRRPVIAVSESTKAGLIRHGFPAGGIHLISEATHLQPLPTLAAALPKYPKPTILSHGSVRPMKRTLHQIQAFELAKATIPDLQLIVSGGLSGSYGRQIQHYVAASPHAASIQLLGRTTDQQKIELMQRCHVITVTSVKEGWGLIVTEAASQGCPAVVYNVDGLRDAVRHDQTGLITSRNTPAGLAETLVSFFAGPERAAALRQAGWEWSRQLTFDQAYADFTRALSEIIAIA